MTSKTLMMAAALFTVVGCAQAKNLAKTAGVSDKEVASAEKTAATETKKAADDAPKDVYQLAAYKGFTQLTAMLSKAGLDKTLEGAGPYTLFAPTDEAFNKLPEEKRAELMTDAGQAELLKILNYHVVDGKLMAADLSTATTEKTLGGADLAVSAKDGKVEVGGAHVTQADLTATNGVIHVVDAVLMPPAS